MDEKLKREKLEKTREGLTLHFAILSQVPKQRADEATRVETIDGYVTTGCYPDGRLGEFFVCLSKKVAGEMGTIAVAIAPLVDAWAKASSVALQHGAPVRDLMKLEAHTQYLPAGPVTGVPGIKKCSSVTDLIARWIISKYASPEETTEDVLAPGVDAHVDDVGGHL